MSCFAQTSHICCRLGMRIRAQRPQLLIFNVKPQLETVESSVPNFCFHYLYSAENNLVAAVEREVRARMCKKQQMNLWCWSGIQSNAVHWIPLRRWVVINGTLAIVRQNTPDRFLALLCSYKKLEKEPWIMSNKEGIPSAESRVVSHEIYIHTYEQILY